MPHLLTADDVMLAEDYLDAELRATEKHEFHNGKQTTIAGGIARIAQLGLHASAEGHISGGAEIGRLAGGGLRPEAYQHPQQHKFPDDCKMMPRA